MTTGGILIQSWQRQCGISTETVWGTGVVPTDFFNINNWTIQDKPVELRDESYDGTGTKLRNWQQGMMHSEFDTGDMPFYPDVAPIPLCGVLGLDTVTGTARTGTIGAVAAGVTTLTYTVVTGGAPIIGDIFALEPGTANAEQVTATNVSGAGPYTLTVAATKFSHGAAAPVSALFKHVITTAVALPASRTLYDYSTAAASNQARSYPGSYFSDASLKWTAASSLLQISGKGQGKPSVLVAKTTASYSTQNPLLGWQAALTLGGAANAKLLDFSQDVKRNLIMEKGSSGTQGPDFGSLSRAETSGKMTLGVQDETEWLAFINQTQPTVSVLFTFGANTFQISVAKPALKAAPLMMTKDYFALEADFDGVKNATDSGCTSYTVICPRSTPFG